jgi:hypothetical protein
MNPRKMPSKRCEQTVLAKSGHHQITHCTCGTIHVTFRNFTLRMTPEDLAAIAEVTAAANVGLECEQPDRHAALH